MLNRTHFKYYLLTLFVFLIFQNCTEIHKGKETIEPANQANNNWCVNNVTEFKRGDIIIKPNMNFMPGSASIPNGVNCGHAVMVTKGYKHNNIDTLLANIRIIESMAVDVPKEFQVREIAANVYNKNPIFNCTSFNNQFTGNRYRLRLNVSEAAIDSILSFACSQKGDYSNWNAMKRYPDNLKSDLKSNWADNTHWYCSLLVWQSVLYVTGIDTDVNKGFQVYPNDLVASPIFDNTVNHIGRARF